MEGFKNIVSAGVAVGFSPVIISEVLGGYLATFGRERMAEAAAGFCVDLMFQATIKYWFPPEGQEITAMESIQGLDYVQASASAVEGLISTQGWRGLVGSAVISCAVDGFSSQGAFHEFSLGECLQGAGSALLVGGVLQGVPALRDRFGGLAKTRLARGISRLAEALGSRVGKAWDMYRYLRPGDISAADVAALFDVDEALAGVAATRIQQSPVLQSLFREGDWWISVREMASSAGNRAQLLDDLTGNVNLAAAFKERPGLVGAWEELPANLRIVVPNLETVSSFISAKNIDPFIIKNEINALPGFKEDLIRGFDVSSGVRSLPTISNKLPSISPEGSIVGSFINGQFIPNGNAIIGGRKYDYIVKSEGQIIVGQKHTFMSQGEDVLAAGEIKFNGAELPVEINNLSGHYQPTPGEAMNFLRAFQQQGVATDNIFLSMYNADGTIFRQIHPNANARILYHQ